MHKLPNKSGISLKPKHYQEIIDTQPDIGWFEVHPENYMSAGGVNHKFLQQINNQYPISMHGVGMSLGSADGLNKEHLDELKTLVDLYQPALISEHLAWSHWKQNYFNDLLPFPYTDESLQITVNNIHQVQDYLGRNILIENPSVYLAFGNNDYSEADFISELIKKTDCQLLLDVNNIFVSAKNTGFSTEEYISTIPLHHVKEIHLAGHSVMPLTEEKNIHIDNHGSKVSDEVWQLFKYTIQQAKREIPTLIEWDTDIPSLSTLLEEALKAEQAMKESLNGAAS